MAFSTVEEQRFQGMIPCEDEHGNRGMRKPTCGSRYPAKVLIIASERLAEGFTSAMASESIESHVVSSAAEIAQLLGHYPHWIALCDVDGQEPRALELLEALRVAGPVPTLILAPAPDLSRFLLESSLGPSLECAAKPIEADELIHRVKALMLRSGYQATSKRFSDPDESQVRERSGRLVTICHAKGGVGASTVATNLAIGLVRTRKARVLLVDADLWFGDIGALLDMSPSNGMARTADAWTGREFDRSALDEVPETHSSGLFVLMRPEDPSSVEQMNPSVIAGAITTYATLFDFVIADTAPGLAEFNLQLLDAAHQIVLVATADVSALYNTRRFLDIGERVGYTQKSLLVLNRADTGVTTDLAEANLKMSASVLLPSAGRLVVDAANRGTPVLLSERRHDHVFERNLLSLVTQVAGPASSESESSSTHGNPLWKMRGGLGLAGQRRAG